VVALVAAALIVGVAIATSGEISKTINGIGGVIWIAAAVTLANRLRQSPGWLKLAMRAFVLTLALVVFVRPTDIIWAAIGFTAAGFLVSLEAPGRRLEWAAFLAAIWLPTHLLVAASRAAERAVRDLPAHVRTDPPPTAALVPFAMVVCALIGSQLASALRPPGE
jgi:hypothetical protein